MIGLRELLAQAPRLLQLPKRLDELERVVENHERERQEMHGVLTQLANRLDQLHITESWYVALRNKLDAYAKLTGDLQNLPEWSLRDRVQKLENKIGLMAGEIEEYAGNRRLDFEDQVEVTDNLSS
jgi:tetrahydromethanopterin S-methyltransferase subunit G